MNMNCMMTQSLCRLLDENAIQLDEENVTKMEP
jgi:hypothetical protein